MKEKSFYEVVKNYLYICSVFKVPESYFDELQFATNKIALCSETIYNNIYYSEKLMNPNDLRGKRFLPAKIKPIISDRTKKKVLEMGLSKSSLEDLVEESKKNWVNVFLAKLESKRSVVNLYRLSEQFEHFLFVSQEWIEKHLIPEDTKVVLRPSYIV
ncbi:MAG: hypothetical protein QXJ17_08610 [Nitrososphaeria archaeon]